ncbi:quercetin dioxygenase-like cupin family protein [Pedobacter sp. UYP24]
MIFKNIIAEIATATKPAVKIIKHSNSFKTIAIGLKAGVNLKEHKAFMPTVLLVTEGCVIYRSFDIEIRLNKHDDLEIPVNVNHSLEAVEDSLCILIQG